MSNTSQGVKNELGMTVEMARKILVEQARRANEKCPAFIQGLHPAQTAFWEDKARFKVAICGRRAGKTNLAYRGLLQGMCANPNTIHAYVGVTRESAKRLAWNPLRRLAKQHGLQIQFNKVELIAYHVNGAELWILGADREEDMDKMRGAAYKRVVIDEAASYRAFIERMVNEVIEPALGDHRGDLWLMGTPGRTAAGYFYDASTQAPGFEKFSVHKWTVEDNPYFLEPTEWLEDLRHRNGWGVDHPTYRREYLGEWCKDDSALVYKFEKERNLIDALPDTPDAYNYVLAMDFGVVDPTAFVILAYHPHDPCVYVVESYKRADLGPSDVAEHIRLLQDRYARIKDSEPLTAFETIVGDTGGMGKAYAKELQSRHAIYVKPAEKREKLAYIDHMNGDLISGRIKLVTNPNEDLVREWQTLPWLTRDGRKQEKYDERRYDDHLADACLYGWRDCRGFNAVDRVTAPQPNTPEFWDSWAKEQEESDNREAYLESQASWWEKGADDDVEPDAFEDW